MGRLKTNSFKTISTYTLDNLHVHLGVPISSFEDCCPRVCKGIGAWSQIAFKVDFVSDQLCDLGQVS